jgi:2'-hydroxyisoflavone reductase
MRQSMNVLVLGGTRFVGRHIVERLARTGHLVTRFHRGRTAAVLPDGVQDCLGDRDESLDTAAYRTWDAIVDVNAYHAAQVHTSLKLSSRWYVLVSSLSVYADLSQPGVTEAAPVITQWADDDAAAKYGGEKAQCEALVREKYGDRCTILRLGIVAGPYDWTGRFSYWCDRAMRGQPFVVPEPRDQPIAFVDARDAAVFAERVLSERVAGTFNVVGPKKHLTMSGLVASCCAAARERGVESSAPLWVAPATLLERGVEPWTDIPLWLDDEKYAGLFSADKRKALASGYAPRPVEETICAVNDWLADSAEARATVAGFAGAPPTTH